MVSEDYNAVAYFHLLAYMNLAKVPMKLLIEVLQLNVKCF